MQDFAPIAIVGAELSLPLSGIGSVDPSGRRYGCALIVVRLQTKTLGVINLE